MTWYDRTKYDVGIDFVFFNDQLEGTLDWFFETTKGFLVANKYAYTDPIGYDLPLEVSRAEDRSEGIDGSLKYTTKFGDVDFSAGFNFTYYNWLTFRSNEDAITLANPRIRKQGYKNHYLETGYIGTQLYQYPEDILNNPKRVTSRDLQPGDLWFQDVNGDGKIDAQDQSRFGNNPSPTFVFGFDVGAGYKGFNVMANIQGTGKRQTYMNHIAMGAEGERRLDFQFKTILGVLTIEMLLFLVREIKA